MTSKLTRPLRAAARSAWALTGTALLAVLIALVAGGATFLIAAGTTPPAPAQERENAENTRVALKAADESRALFGLLSNAVVSAGNGLNTSAGSVPQIFDSIDTAKTGAEQLVSGLDEASSLSAALNQVNRATATLGGALERTQGLQQVAAGTRAALVALRGRLIEHPAPGSAEAVAQLDRALAGSKGVGALDDVAGLRGTLSTMTSSLSSASANADASLTSARSAARQLRDGLTKLASARKDVNASVTNLTTGVGQLKTALGAIDGQLALTQTRLRSVTSAPAPAPDPGIARPLAWALVVGGAAGTVSYLAALAVAHRLRRREAVAVEAVAVEAVAVEAVEVATADLAESAGDAATEATPAEEVPVTGHHRVLPPADAIPDGAAEDALADPVGDPAPEDAEGTALTSGKRPKHRRNRFRPAPADDTNPYLSVAFSGSAG
ncbi:hypothetical protein [Tsukamurella paurometabola]|uniref:Uncharacterized protein n=1 Tax=Tsukamurella paurometabola TaxID=2061 RepID=A0A3P8LF65_TSUPA|nr:hypothetical protein [Tsukamurella paurometabola]UEA82402.1 hypothetical protein LK411_18815 [Tsukamurella paurometabola]VDR39452.1 Uncharacterised protein [Tsukamurella paurometabola]